MTFSAFVLFLAQWSISSAKQPVNPKIKQIPKVIRRASIWSQFFIDWKKVSSKKLKGGEKKWPMVEHSSAGASGPLISGSDAPNRIPRPKNRSRVVRIMSPPALPPCWGQDVAPPPTPLFFPTTFSFSSNTSPKNPSHWNQILSLYPLRVFFLN